MSLVLDASATLAWYFEDERTDAGDALMRQVAQNGAVVPFLWRYEVANGFLVAARRRRIDIPYRDVSLAELRLLPITVDRADQSSAWDSVLVLADRSGLTIYDAAYLDLAIRRKLPLATRDRALQGAAKAMSVEVLG